jgi:hypothetical protein
LTSETQEEIFNGGGISRFLQIFLASGSFYVHANETLEHAVLRLFVIDKLSQQILHKISTTIGGNTYDIVGSSEKLFFNLICFALYQADQKAMLESFLEHPEAIFGTLNEELENPSEFEGLRTLLHRGRAKCGYSIEGLVQSTKFNNMDMHDALDGQEDPFAGAWYSKFNLRRYFLSSCGYLGLSIHHIEPRDGIYLIKGASVPYIFRPVSGNPADGVHRFQSLDIWTRYCELIFSLWCLVYS